MRKHFSAPIAAACMALSFSSFSNELGTCMVDALNGKERKLLAKWIYSAVSAHPEFAPYSKISDQDRPQIDSDIAKLIMRLLVEDCAEQFASASKSDPMAVNKAFEIIGGVAMQELITDDRVESAISGYSNYLDLEKINSVAALK